MKKSKFKLTFTLQQHTPMIHFQHDQAGATLRGTELKPKLDRFIIQKMGGWEKIPDDWKVGGSKSQHQALDYKVRIEAIDVELTPIKKQDKVPMFFGAMGDDYNLHPKAKSFTEKPILVVFQSFNNELKDTIEQNFAPFLARTNFGTRQNKGYGSFFLDSKKHTSAANAFDRYPSISFSIPKRKKPRNQYQDAPPEDELDLTHVFNVINYYYQRLKSGINYCYNDDKIDYQHSFLKLYLSQLNLGYQWEKRWLKEKFIGLKPNNTPKKYARAMLGVVGNYTFKPNKGKTCAPEDANKIYPKNEKTIAVSSNQVERFKSPITFKPIINGTKVRIYIVTNEIPKQLLGKDFTFTENSNSHTLSTPDRAIKLDNLIEAYHKELTNSFTAYTFTGRPSYPVTIQAPNQ